MSVTSGFFNSTNRDRLYNATDFGRFFEGIVTDGVLSGFKDGLTVPNTSAVGFFQVKSGKAWFNGIWISNDDDLILNTTAPTTANSYALFAVVVEANYTTREGSIKLVSTSDIPSSTTLANGVENVLKPLLRNDATRYSGIHQYVLAVARKNTSSVTFASFAELTGQMVQDSSSPYHSIQSFIAPYAAGLDYSGTIPDPFNYEGATNKPSINGVTLSGNKTTEDLGITANGSIFLGPAQITTGSSATDIHLVYSNVGTLPAGNPKKIILYGQFNSFFYFRLEYVYLASQYCPVSATTSSLEQESVLPRTYAGNSLQNFTQSGASVSFDIISLTNRSALNNILETELVW